MKKRTQLLTAIFLLTLTAGMAWTYPNNVPLGELAFRAVGLSPWSKDTSGLYFPGILFTLIFLAGLVLMNKALRQRRLLITIGLLLFIPMIPQTVASGYQSVFAEGIYTLELRNGNSCAYRADQGDVSGSCSFTFKNYGNSEVSFKVSVKDLPSSPASVVADLDVIGNQLLTIGPREQKTFSVPFQIKLPDQYTAASVSGTINNFNITVKDGEQVRDLRHR